MKQLGNTLNYRIGIDVGEYSVGLSAIEFDDDDHAVSILSCLSHIHDGGKLAGTDKSPQSRLAVAGVQRRTRRLRRRLRARLKALDSYLLEQKFPVGVNEPQTYSAWESRYELVQEYIEDAQLRNMKLSVAIRHIARHRGWKNPWWTHNQLKGVAENSTPSTSFIKMRESASEKYGFDSETITTIGILGYLGVTQGNPNRRLRQSTAEEKKDRERIFFERIMQEDHFAELQEIFRVQKVDESISKKILELVFDQKMPHVPKDRVGNDPLLPDEKRATRASLEFQKVRMLNAISNLRIREKGADRQFSKEEYEKTLDFLNAWKDATTSPNRNDVAHFLGLNPAQLRFPTWDEDAGSSAFFDATSLEIKRKFNSKDPLGKWWDSASFHERSDFVDFIADKTDEDYQDDLPFLRFLEDESIMETINKLKLASGRAAYSRETYSRLIPIMIENRCSEREAIKSVFNIGDDWKPPLPGIEDPVGQPAVDRVLTIVRRYVLACTDKWGVPQSITIEHVRDAFIGPAALATLKYEVAQRTKKNAELREHLQASSSGMIRKSDLRRERQIQRQNSICLYCGTTLSFETCQLDHIVPQADGGSNRGDNLVAVCKECNQSKSALPFIYWAQNNKNPEISLDKAIERIKNWDKGNFHNAQWARFKKDVEARLSLESDDETIDERALASTAYAALEVRNRLESYFISNVNLVGGARPKISVYSGAINSIARKSSGIDDLIQLRDKTHKSRLDRRHHAIDAAVLTTINESIAQTLAKKLQRKKSAEYSNNGNTSWKDFEGASPEAINKYRHWLNTCESIGILMKEEIERDRIAVMRSLRINATSGEGSVHDDTVRPLETVPTNLGLAPEQVRRISDRKILNRILDSLEDDFSLSATSAARLLTPEIKLFAGNSAQIPVRGGSCQIGNSVHHARVFAYQTKRGINFGWIRVFSGEFPHIGFAKPGVDILRAPIPFDSQSMLKAHPGLVKMIASGEAKQIGWITQDDEIEFNPSQVLESASEESEDGQFEKFLRVFPENRWILTGLESAIQLKISPSLLSREGVGKEFDTSISDVISRRAYIKPSVNPFFNLPELKILRRSVLGVPRWKDAGLPYSWSPMQEAKQALGQ
jgi:CRISPR-associated endonuclease Csn1